VWWLEMLISVEAVLTFLFAGLSGLLLTEVARSVRTASRRLAACVLGFVCACLALEALLFLLLPAPPDGVGHTAALLVLRSGLLASSALVFLLLVRGIGRSQ
jgi:hypothetical protein